MDTFLGILLFLVFCPLWVLPCLAHPARGVPGPAPALGQAPATSSWPWSRCSSCPPSTWASTGSSSGSSDPAPFPSTSLTCACASTAVYLQARGPLPGRQGQVAAPVGASQGGLPAGPAGRGRARGRREAARPATVTLGAVSLRERLLRGRAPAGEAGPVTSKTLDRRTEPAAALWGPSAGKRNRSRLQAAFSQGTGSPEEAGSETDSPHDPARLPSHPSFPELPLQKSPQATGGVGAPPDPQDDQEGEEGITQPCPPPAREAALSGNDSASTIAHQARTSSCREDTSWLRSVLLR